jgi:hypothetical protein
LVALVGDKSNAKALEIEYNEKLKKGVRTFITLEPLEKAIEDGRITFEIAIKSNDARGGGEIDLDYTPIDEQATQNSNIQKYTNLKSTYLKELAFELSENPKGPVVKKEEIILKFIYKPKEVEKAAKLLAQWEDLIKGITLPKENIPGVYRTAAGKKLKVEVELVRVGGLHSPTWDIEHMKDRAKTGLSNRQSRFSSQDEISSSMQFIASKMEPGNTIDGLSFNTNAFIIEYDKTTDSYITSSGASSLFVKIYSSGEVHMFPK